MTENIFKQHKAAILNQATSYYNELEDDDIDVCADVVSHIFTHVLLESMKQGVIDKHKGMQIAHSVVAAYAIASSLEESDIRGRVKWMKTNLDDFNERATRIAMGNVSLMNEINEMVDNNWEEILGECIENSHLKVDYRTPMVMALMIKAAFANNIQVDDPKKNIFQGLIDWLESDRSDMD